MSLTKTIWVDEPGGWAHHWDDDFQFDVGQHWDGEITVWIDDED